MEQEKNRVAVVSLLAAIFLTTFKIIVGGVPVLKFLVAVAGGDNGLWLPLAVKYIDADYLAGFWVYRTAP